MSAYDPQRIEKKWQRIWKDQCNFVAQKITCKKKKYYILEMFPYPSGKIHMGHVRNYTLGDVLARFYKSNDYNVLHPMGWDSFGMPAENAAIENKLNPKSWTYQNIKKMRSQLASMGLSIDWNREISTSSPDYYKHQQKFFIDLYKNGLAYKKDSFVNWDPVDNTVLANEQVIDGKGWRSGVDVVSKKLSQWFFKISKFSNELLSDLDSLDNWPSKVKIMQKNWIGVSEGVEIKFSLTNEKSSINVFTTRPETIFGASFIALAINHPLSTKYSTVKSFNEFYSKCKISSSTEESLSTSEKIGYNSKLFANHPFIKGIKLPIYFANFVLMEYGTGAVFGCPAHDERDFEFAKKYNLPVKKVINKNTPIENISDQGFMVNSDFLDGIEVKSAKELITKKIENLKLGRRKTSFRLRDWGVSRQRYWGCPIPIMYREDGEIITVPENELPVILPDDVDFSKGGNPLSNHPTWKYTKCPSTGMKAIRETDTLDTFVDSSWYFLRFCSPRNENSGFDINAVNYWMPVDQYVGGIEHAILHLLYSRFFVRALNTCSYNIPKEPFKSLLTQGMVCHETFKTKDSQWVEPKDVIKKDKKYFNLNNIEIYKGRSEKMSKSKKNIIDPESIITRYGADTARLFMMSDSPPERDLEWSDEGAKAIFKYLSKVYLYLYKNDFSFTDSNDFKMKKEDIYYENLIFLHMTIDKYTNDIVNQHFNSSIARLREISNKLFSLKYSKNKAFNDFSWSIYLRLIFLFTPHFSEEIAFFGGLKTGLSNISWPQINKSYLNKEQVNLVVQVNGKKKVILNVPFNSDQDTVIKILKEQKELNSFLLKEPIKTIYIKNKIINFVIK